MPLSDPISLLFTQSPTDYILHWEYYPPNPDTHLFPDLKAQLELNTDYHHDRQIFYKEIQKPKRESRYPDHVKYRNWIYFGIKDEPVKLYGLKYEFCKHYITYLYKDLKTFSESYFFDNSEQAAKSFCVSFRGYANTYGEELIRRVYEHVNETWKQGIQKPANYGFYVNDVDLLTEEIEV
jgi:hypothetical protein